VPVDSLRFKSPPTQSPKQLPAIILTIILTKFSEQTVDKFYIPSFILTKGDIIIIQLPGGPYFRPVELKMIHIVTGKQYNNLIEINTPLKYVEHIAEKSFWYRLFPMTVGGYLDKYANKSNPVCNTIYNTKWITPKKQNTKTSRNSQTTTFPLRNFILDRQNHF
jgi:hypothetical protein